MKFVFKYCFMECKSNFDFRELCKTKMRIINLFFLDTQNMKSKRKEFFLNNIHIVADFILALFMFSW